MILEELDHFGPIKKLNCAIELKPLTIFMGDNSAGKTLLASLFYNHSRILKSHHLLIKVIEDVKKDINGIDFICKLKNRFEYINPNEGLDKVFEYNLNIDENDIPQLVKLQHKLMNTITSGIMKKDYESILTDDTVIAFVHDYDFESCSKDKIVVSYLNNNVLFQLEDKELTIENNEDKEYVFNKMTSFIIETVFKKILKKELYSNTAYIPAARTGLMKSYNIIAETALDKSNMELMEKNFDFTLPEIEFVRRLAGKSKSKSSRLTTFIEKSILNGKITLDKDTNEFNFKIGGKEVSKKLYSSTLTEILPLILFLKKGFISKGTFLVIEEPEAHLSLKNQELMAHVIIKLIQQGVHVLLTTHSEYLIYIFNNIIKSNTLKKKIQDVNEERFDETTQEVFRKLKSSIEEKNFINHKKVAVYNLENKNEETNISKVPVDKTGIYNEYIKSINFKTIKESNLLFELMDLTNA